MCLNLELFFFRVSSLAYPNLLGKKGYVVVDVVVGLYFLCCPIVSSCSTFVGQPRGVILMRLEHAGKTQSASLISAAAAEVAED